MLHMYILQAEPNRLTALNIGHVIHVFIHFIKCTEEILSFNQQICRFCWHRIRTDENGLCPACRKVRILTFHLRC